MVTLDNFCFQPPHAAPTTRRFNLRCTQPGMVAIIGGNGSGKSTLAQLLAGWYPEHLPGAISGTCTLLGKPIGQQSLPEQAQSIQLVQQSPWLQLSGCTFSVEEEVAFGPENLCLPPAAILQRIENALTLTDCQTLRQRNPAELSGGEAQRVTIACALAMQPRLLLLDEAFGRLAPQAAHRMLERLARWAQTERAQVILFERDITPIQSYCQHSWRLTGEALEPLC